jgi:hypothetical protein
VITLGGIAVYGALNSAYDRFYGALGVDPSDIGLGYAQTLSRSVGFIVVFVFLVALLTAIIMLVSSLFFLPSLISRREKLANLRLLEFYTTLSLTRIELRHMDRTDS